MQLSKAPAILTANTSLPTDLTSEVRVSVINIIQPGMRSRGFRALKAMNDPPSSFHDRTHGHGIVLFKTDIYLVLMNYRDVTLVVCYQLSTH